MKKRGTTSRDFVERLDLIDLSSPQDAAEIKDNLESVGLDSVQLLAEAMRLVDEFETRKRKLRLTEAAALREQELKQIGSRPRSTLTEAAMRSRLEHLSSRPGGSQLHFKNLKSCSSDELKALLEEFSYLEEEDEPKKD